MINPIALLIKGFLGADPELGDIAADSLVGLSVPVISCNGILRPFQPEHRTYLIDDVRTETVLSAHVIAAKFVLLHPTDGHIFKEANTVAELTQGVTAISRELYRFMGYAPTVELRYRVRTSGGVTQTIRTGEIKLPEWEKSLCIAHLESAQKYGFYASPEEYFTDYLKNGGLKVDKPGLICARLCTVSSSSTRFLSATMNSMELLNVTDTETGSKTGFEQYVIWSNDVQDARSMTVDAWDVKNIKLYRRPPISKAFLRRRYPITTWPEPAPFPEDA